MPSKKSEINLTYIIIAGILGFAVLGYGFLQYQAKQNELELKRDEQRQEIVNQGYYKTCTDEANNKASELLKDKVAISRKTGVGISAVQTEAAEKGMYLKDDFDTYYKGCLGKYGLKVQ